MIFAQRGHCAHPVKWGEYHCDTPSEGITQVKRLSSAEGENLRDFLRYGKIYKQRDGMGGKKLKGQARSVMCQALREKGWVTPAQRPPPALQQTW
jgi:hypothetical protein